jgi:hypothetical protein
MSSVSHLNQRDERCTQTRDSAPATENFTSVFLGEFPHDPIL